MDALFDFLQQQNLDALRAMLTSLSTDAPAAEDVVQDACLVAWQRLSRFDPSRPFAPWIRGIARRLMWNQVRRVRNAPIEFDSERLEAAPAAGTAPSRQGPHDELLARLRTALDRLPAPQRRVLECHYQDDMSCPAIAAELGLGVEAVKKHLQRGRRRLQELLPEATLDGAPG